MDSDKVHPRKKIAAKLNLLYICKPVYFGAINIENLYICHLAHSKVKTFTTGIGVYFNQIILLTVWYSIDNIAAFGPFYIIAFDKVDVGFGLYAILNTDVF